MKRKQYSKDQIIRIVKEAGGGESLAEEAGGSTRAHSIRSAPALASR